MTQYLHDYFSGHAERAIAGMKDALIAQRFYERLVPRLEQGEDLSGELPIIAKVGNAGALEVVHQAIEENKALITSVWELPAKVKALGTLGISMTKDPYEHLPRVTLDFDYRCPAGALNVKIQTAGESFKIEFNTEKTKMAAEMAMRELEKEISFALLSA
jgi:hypothetical protein